MSVAAEGGGDGNAALSTAESATVVVDESQGTFDDSFFNKIGGAGGAVGPSGRPRSFTGPYAQRTQEIMDAFEAKGGPPTALKPLTAFHRNLSLHVDVSGLVPLTDVAGFLVELVPAMEQEKFGSQVVTPWLRRLLLGSNNPLRALEMLLGYVELMPKGREKILFFMSLPLLELLLLLLL